MDPFWIYICTAMTILGLNVLFVDDTGFILRGLAKEQGLSIVGVMKF